MTDRLFAIAWLVVCAVIIAQMWTLSVPIAYEPVGPKAFPMLLAGLMALCCVFMLARPDPDTHGITRALLVKGTVLIATLLAYAILFSLAGFMLSTAAMGIAVSRIFGGSWLQSIVVSAAISVAGFVVFDQLLEVSLPLGRLWR